MMMTEVANHSKRNHTTDSYFSGKQAVGTSSGSEEFASMGSKKPRNTTSPRGGGPISPKEKKDKVGERVAALQQLVSPFGKTDTASVLQEASGYIKFLHQQLEVLSSPYMRAPPAPGAEPEDPDHYSLGNRGLCLVPVERTLQLTQSNGADLWAPAHTTKRSLEAASPGYGKDIDCVLAEKASEDLIRKVEKSLRKVSLRGRRRKRGVTRKASDDD